MSYSKSILSAAIAAAGLIAVAQTATATTTVVVKRDHRTPPVVRDHREKPVVRDHRGDDSRVRPGRSPKIICASWTC